MLSIPPLPASWPYAVRSALAGLQVREGAVLPGLDGTWTTWLASHVDLDRVAEPLGASFGRGGLRKAGDFVLRPYRRGGWVRHVNERIYVGASRFVHEFEAHRALWEAGFPTVEPSGYAFRRAWWGYEGVYVTRFTPSTPWPRVWERSTEVLPQLRKMLEALCAWGLHAPDLNATNILLCPDGTILALDWDKAQWTDDSKLMGRYQDRLLRSLVKLDAPKEILKGVAGKN